MILTDHDKMALTPTYYVYKMYVPFQDFTFVPVTLDDQAAEVQLNMSGINAKSAAGETLTAPKVDNVNTFEAPNGVAPKAISARAQGGKLILQLEPKSMTVVSVEQQQTLVSAVAILGPRVRDRKRLRGESNEEVRNRYLCTVFTVEYFLGARVQ